MLLRQVDPVVRRNRRLVDFEIDEDDSDVLQVIDCLHNLRTDLRFEALQHARQGNRVDDVITIENLFVSVGVAIGHALNRVVFDLDLLDRTAEF